MAEKTLQRLIVRKLADTSEGTRVERYNQITGEKVLVNPETNAEEPWPLAGVEIVGDAPEYTLVPTSWVNKAKAEGWVTLENEQVVHRPGGPPEDQWKVTHSFVHADALVIHTTDGDIRYTITHQPDKYADDSRAEGDKRLPGKNSFDDETEVTRSLYEAGNTRVDWFYELELEA